MVSLASKCTFPSNRLAHGLLILSAVLADRNVLPSHEDILKVHTRKMPLAADVDLAQVAAGTPGFSGADLKNLVNEAAILAAREQATQVAMSHFDEARDKVMLGTVRSLAIQPDERHRLAVHEAGHTLVAYFLPHTDPLYKVTIIPRGRALGGTHQLPVQEWHTLCWRPRKRCNGSRSRPAWALFRGRGNSRRFHSNFIIR